MSNPIAALRHKEETLAELVTVTPSMALDWLTQPTYRGPNRRLSNEWVAELARRMKSGRWRITGEAIKFGVSGHLIDGQHRLHAIVESDTAITTYVVWGVRDEAQDVMDSGRRRTAADALSIREIPHYTALAAAAKTLIRMQRHLDDRDSRVPISTDEVVEFIEAHPELIAPASEFVKPRVGIPPATYLAAMLLAYQCHPEEALGFNGAYATGASLEPGNAALVLRERAMQLRVSRERHPSGALISAVLRCFEAWRLGKHIQKVQLYKDGAIVPAPAKYRRSA